MKKSIDIENIIFDEDDKNLFLVDSPRLRADALRYSIAPKMRVLLIRCAEVVREIYSVDVFEASRIATYPAFRVKRKSELQELYEAAFVGLGGKSEQKRWKGFDRDNGKPVQMIPFRYGFRLTSDGLAVQFETDWLTLGKSSYQKLLKFWTQNDANVISLCSFAGMDLFLLYEAEPYIKPLVARLQSRFEKKIYEHDFVSETQGFPVYTANIDELISQFVWFYPIYDSYIQIGMNKTPRLLELIDKANTWLAKNELPEKYANNQSDIDKIKSVPSDEIKETARSMAEKRVQVMPALRWQVFMRDNWRCVACGRSAIDDIILQVDHIIPRSKSGKDSLDNFQTLCHECNLGKSNKDKTNLRNR